MAYKFRNLDHYLSLMRLRKATRLKNRVVKLKKVRLRNNLRRDAIFKNFGSKSKIISLMAQRSPHPKEIHQESIEIKLGNTFSVAENPEEVINLLLKLSTILDDNKELKEIVFNYDALVNYDLAANALLDLIVVEKNRELKRTYSKLKVRGAYPKNNLAKRFIKAIGIIKHLDVKHEFLNINESKKIKKFEARNHHYYRGTGLKSDYKDLKLMEFSDHIDSCLKDMGYVLTEDGRGSLISYAGEILGNAEEHAGLVDWSIQGYMDKELPEPICEIAIFNFGRSISDNFKKLKNTDYTWQQIGHYLMLHQARNYFGHSWKLEDLLTIISLQENVSTKNYVESDDRGKGSIDMIRFFQEVHKACGPLLSKARMTIISGSTWIHFDGTYAIQERGSNKGALITFNKEGRLEAKPDEKYIKNLSPNFFPGTIISIKFPIRNSALVEEL